MKKLTTLISVSIVLFTACTKSDVIKPTSVSVGTTDLSTSSTLRTNEQLLTSKTWIYTRYYTGYAVAYNRGRAVNTIDLDNNTVKFNADGTDDEYTNTGEYVPGHWHFTNDEQTQMVVINSYGTFPSSIVKLNNNKFIWVGSSSETTGVMEPQE